MVCATNQATQSKAPRLRGQPPRPGTPTCGVSMKASGLTSSSSKYVKWATLPRCISSLLPTSTSSPQVHSKIASDAAIKSWNAPQMEELGQALRSVPPLDSDRTAIEVRCTAGNAWLLLTL